MRINQISCPPHLIVILALALVLPDLLFGGEPSRPEVPIFGVKRVKGGVNVIFSLDSWPSGWEGVIVGRRSGTRGAGPWEFLNKSPILPVTVNSISWRKLGLDAKQSLELKDWAMQKAGSNELLSYFLEEGPMSQYAGTRHGGRIIRMAYERAWGKGDFRYALVYGVGYMDKTAKPGREYEYGLFSSKDWKPVPEPLVTCQLVKEQDPKTTGFRLEKLEGIVDGVNQIELEWRIDIADCKRFNFDVCRLYRADASASMMRFEPLDYVPGFRTGDKEEFLFFHHDRPRTTGGDARKAYVYKIVPVTYFKEELPVSWRVEYRPDAGGDDK